MTEAEQEAFAAHPDMRDLADLRDSGGWLFIHRQNSSGEVNLLTGFRTWPDGSYEALAVEGEADARAWRTNPDGAVVWKHEGGLAEVVNGILELPPPDQPLAPRLVIPGPAPILWTP